MSIPSYLQDFVVSIDTETAVLGDHVIEVGISIFKGGELISEYGTLVKPIVPIDPKASEVHHIYDKDLIDAPSFADIAQNIHNSISFANVMLAYNWDYDATVLNKEFNRLGIKLPNKPMVDPLIFFKQYHKFNKGKKLIDAASKFGIKYIGAHRAVNDATVAGRVLFRMAALKPDFPKTLKDLVVKQRQWIELQFKDYDSYCKKV